MITIEKASSKDVEIIARLAGKLLSDLNTRSQRDYNVDTHHLENIVNQTIARNNFAAYIAYHPRQLPVGLITIAGAFSIYNDGDYGVITELFVDKGSRSLGIGNNLLNAAYGFAKTMNWSTIEVGAPNSDQWPRTTSFYRKNGFQLKGPKLTIKI